MEFFQKYKKIIFIIIFLLLPLLIGYLLYVVFFVQTGGPVENKPAATENISPITSGLPVAGGKIAANNYPGGGEKKEEGGANGTDIIKTEPVAPVTDNQILGAAADGANIKFYDQSDGKFYRVGNDGQIIALNDQKFFDVKKVTWSPDRQNAVLEYPDGANIVYDFNGKKQITLPAHWEGFAFSPDGASLVFKSIGMDPNNRWLAITNANGTKSRRIEEIGLNADKVIPLWSPNNQMIALYTEGIDMNRQEVFFVGLNGENFKSMVVEGRGFIPKWSPKGDRLLYSVYSTDTNLKPMLWIDNAVGDNIGTARQRLDVETWANKCVFKDDTAIYCGVPDYLEEGSGMMPELAQSTRDRLYQIDLKTGAKKIIASPSADYNVAELMLSADGQHLYFTDADTKKLFKIDL